MIPVSTLIERTPHTNIASPSTPWHGEKREAEPDAPIRYCLYARKSSEDDERQALSIESQIKEMMAVAKRDGLDVRGYAKYVLKNGTAEEKREILGCLKSRLVLADAKIWLKE